MHWQQLKRVLLAKQKKLAARRKQKINCEKKLEKNNSQEKKKSKQAKTQKLETIDNACVVEQSTITTAVEMSTSQQQLTVSATADSTQNKTPKLQNF